MDEYSGKRPVDGPVFPRKGSGLLLRDNANNRDQSSQYCNRLGCNGRLNSTKYSQVGSLEKAKATMPFSGSSSSGKERVRTFSRTYSAVGNSKKPITELQRKSPSRLDMEASESGNTQDMTEVSRVISQSGNMEGRLPVVSTGLESTDALLIDRGRPCSMSSTRSGRSSMQRSGMRNEDIPGVSSVSVGSKGPGQAMLNSTGRHVRNLRSNSVADTLPSSSASSEKNLSKRTDLVKRRNFEGESSSSSRVKKTSESSLEGRNSSLGGLSISDSRGGRNIPPRRENNIASGRTRRLANGQTRARLFTERNCQSLHEPPIMFPHLSGPDISVDVNAPSSSHTFSAELTSSRPIAYSRPGSSGENAAGTRPASPAEFGITRSLVNHDGFRRYNVNGVAELLLALDRIEQDEELTFEQVILLETNLFLNGLNFYDQHRDMRLDIDHMTYEELLALEERMGSVSTALTDEELSQCLKRSLYQSLPLTDTDMACTDGKDDVKCCICQEDYLVGDEVGNLPCEHGYHAACIEHWLRQKNWCPICKASAAPSPKSPASVSLPP